MRRLPKHKSEDAFKVLRTDRCSEGVVSNPWKGCFYLRRIQHPAHRILRGVLGYWSPHVPIEDSGYYSKLVHA